MGHFRRFCGITHTPIGCGERCVGVWVNTNTRFHCGEFHGYSARSLIYRGEYDDYGRLDLDEPDHKYVTSLLSKDDIENGPDMFILETVYDQFVNFSADKWGDHINDGSSYENSDVSKLVLEMLNFQVVEDNELDKRYQTTYQHPDIKDYLILSDGTWIRVFSKESCSQLNVGIYNPKQFDSFLQKNGVTLDFTVLKELPNEILSIKSKIIAFQEEMAEYSLDNIEDEEVSQKLKVIFDRRKEYAYKQTSDSLGITKEMMDFIEEEEFQKELAYLLRISKFMTCVNLRFGYRFDGGPQDGNFQANRKLQELMNISIENSHYNRKSDDDNEG